MKLLVFFNVCLAIPKVSVVVPAYNREFQISFCVHSILNQTLKNIEVVCVDDGSTDGTFRVLKKIAESDRRVTVIHQENCGPACARNAGLRLVTGDYIGFVDSDDFVEVNTYEIAYQKALDSSADVVIWGMYFGEKKRYKGPPKELIFRGIDSALFFFPQNIIVPSSCLCSCCNKLYRRLLIENNHILFDVSVKYKEDFLFNFDLSRVVSSVVCINRPFYHYIRLKNGLMNAHSREDRRNYNRGFVRHLMALECKEGKEEESDRVCNEEFKIRVEKMLADKGII